MRRAMPATAVTMALLLPTGVTAEDSPQVVCTRVDLSEGHILADHESARLEPDDRACDVIVYLPLAVADGLMVGQLAEAAEREAEREAAEAESRAARYAALAWAEDKSCNQLDAWMDSDVGLTDDQVAAATSVRAARCLSCEELAEERDGPGPAAAAALVKYILRCQGSPSTPE